MGASRKLIRHRIRAAIYCRWRNLGLPATASLQTSLFRLQMFAELHGAAPGIGHQGEAAGGAREKNNASLRNTLEFPKKTSRGEGTAILTRVGIDNSLFGSRLTSAT